MLAAHKTAKQRRVVLRAKAPSLARSKVHPMVNLPKFSVEDKAGLNFG
jgi:hypothetical protein